MTFGFNWAVHPLPVGKGDHRRMAAASAARKGPLCSWELHLIVLGLVHISWLSARVHLTSVGTCDTFRELRQKACGRIASLRNRSLRFSSLSPSGRSCSPGGVFSGTKYRHCPQVNATLFTPTSSKSVSWTGFTQCRRQGYDCMRHLLCTTKPFDQESGFKARSMPDCS